MLASVRVAALRCDYPLSTIGGYICERNWRSRGVKQSMITALKCRSSQSAVRSGHGSPWRGIVMSSRVCRPHALSTRRPRSRAHLCCDRPTKLQITAILQNGGLGFIPPPHGIPTENTWNFYEDLLGFTCLLTATNRKPLKNHKAMLTTLTLTFRRC